MIATKFVIVATVLCLATPIVPALAHDDDDYSYNNHWQFHDQLSGAHERAHEEGFESRAEHRAYHRALRDLHDDFHENQLGIPDSQYYARPGFRAYWGYWR
jgi:hypothetical protein